MRLNKFSRALRLTSALSIGATMVLSLSAPAFALNECFPRLMSKNIREAVLAYKAAQYCKNMPYTIDQASHRVDELRCNTEANAIIDNLVSAYNAEYKLTLTGQAAVVGCGAAAQIAW